MEIDKSKTIKKQSNKTVLLTVRVTPEVSKWLAKEKISPTGLFYEALNAVKCPCLQNEERQN